MLALNRVAALVVAFVVIFIFILTTASLHGGKQTIHKIKESAQSAANNICNNDRPLFGKPTISDSFLRLFENIHHPIASPTYTDASGKVFDVKEDAPWWHEPLRNQILIVDIDTRVPNGPNELWNDKRLDWDAMKAKGDGGMVSASFMNHFLYCECCRLHGKNEEHLTLLSANTRLRLPLLQCA